MPVPAWLRRQNAERDRQLEFAFLRSRARSERRFKRLIALATLLAAGLSFAIAPAGRRAVALARISAETWAGRWAGLEPTRTQIEAALAVRRERGVVQTERNLRRFLSRTTPEMNRLFDTAGMTPETAIIRWGFGDWSFVISSRVFEIDDSGRSFRMKPNVRSIWLRQVTIRDGPFGMFLVPDDAPTRRAALAAGAIVDEGSVQVVNTWGFRGREPDLKANLRGIVLGDSFMLGMFVGDPETPPARLEKRLAETSSDNVCVLNTGSIGYSPEQYFHTLRTVGDRFAPHFVVVSVCPNDFGDASDALAGRGDWNEAEYWIERIFRWCRGRNAVCLLVIVPCDVQFMGPRHEGFYPGEIANHFAGSPLHYLNPLDDFIDEHLRLVRIEESDTGRRPQTSPLYNRGIGDNHFSPAGCDLWAKAVARRLRELMPSPSETAAEP